MADIGTPPLPDDLSEGIYELVRLVHVVKGPDWDAGIASVCEQLEALSADDARALLFAAVLTLAEVK